MKNKIMCSVNVLSYNNGSTIEKCISSVVDFDEILVNDGGSTDDTLEICRKYDCKIITQDKKYKNSDNTIRNFSALRNEIIKLSKHDWVFILDTDESISIETINEINEIVKKNDDNEIVFRMLRKYIVNSEIIDNCITYPSYQTRLFRKDGIYGYENELHEIIRVRDNVRLFDLKNHLYVYQPSIKELKKKWNYYIDINANIRHKNITYYNWFRGTVINYQLASLKYFLYFLRYKISFKGKDMPVSYELLRIWYNTKMTLVITKNVFKRFFKFK